LVTEGGAPSESLIVKLESRRIVCEAQRASLTRTIESPQTNIRVREACIRRFNDLTRELERIEEVLEILRGEHLN
jgi:hypothetical protein